jgi:hypothetical protein
MSHRKGKHPRKEAIVCDECGPLEIVQLKQVTRHTPKDNLALVKVHTFLDHEG